MLDDEHKAAMVGNLLVVLCGETEAKSVINATAVPRLSPPGTSVQTTGSLPCNIRQNSFFVA